MKPPGRKFFHDIRPASDKIQNLIDELETVYGEGCNYFKKKYERSLPFNEMLVDRWKRAQDLGFGKGTSIYDSVIVFGDVTVGEGTWIGPFVILDGSGGLKIGSHCSISSGVQIYTHDAVKWALSGGRYRYEKMPVTIEDCCFIGAATIILKGVTIGKHCLIGANSLVNKSIPSNSVAVGSPATVIKKIEIDSAGKISFHDIKEDAE